MMNINKLLIILLSIFILILPACRQEDPAGPLTDPVEPIPELEQLLLDVFAPQAKESVLVMIDLPHDFLDDNPAWEARREMANEWLAAFQRLSKRLDFTVDPMLTYPATDRHNGPLPAEGEQDGDLVQLEVILSNSHIVVAMTEYSATASLIGFTEQFPDLRAASMPLVSSSMMQTALVADYGQMAEKCHILAGRPDRADRAWLTFSTGHELTVDLRFRHAEVDDGQLHTDKQGVRVINLPRGEAYLAPYEGELEGHPSKTSGEMPLLLGEGMFPTVQIVENRIVVVQGDSPAAEEVRSFFAVDEARRNLAELGLGCNDKAVISGNVLEDEKVMGVHLAAGLSEHIGGAVGVDDFEDPANVCTRTESTRPGARSK
jgi:hypothetical protein